MWEQVKSAYPGPTANWDAEPPAIWAYAIDGLTGDQVANGVRNLVHHASEFPPSAGQFRDLCLTSYTWQTRCHKTIDTSHLIEDTTAKEERCTEGLNAIRALRAEVGL